jgi:catechol 2,3-dioxygenase-like lactoylglutathione lyase family enzyme
MLVVIKGGGHMLKDYPVTATIAVKDGAKGRQFYSEVLGLELVNEDQIMVFKSGGNTLYVYESPTGGTGQASCATWNVKADDMEALVKDLQSKGVEFERYDFGGGKPDGPIHEGGGGKAAWLKDPDGNILALVSM